MTEVERADLDNRTEDERIRWVVCERVWTVVADDGGSDPKRQEVVPGVNAVAAWRAEREAARRLRVVERKRLEW